MQTALADSLKLRPQGAEAEAILRACVHCGFCLPSCPTYQLLGDELDSPRGRIYLIKQLLEGGPATASTQLHLDRCLTCRACESACPSGVQYGRLLDIGRGQLAERGTRPVPAAAARYLLRKLVPYPQRVRALLRIAQALRPVLPAGLKSHVPVHATAAAKAAWPAARHARRVVLLEGCVQPALAPEINLAAARVLDGIGISALRAPLAGCCGAVTHHLGAGEETLRQLRRTVAVLGEQLEAGAEAVLFTSSACSAMLGEYGRLLRDEPRYAARAAAIAAAARDISQVVATEATTLGAALQRAARAAGATRAPLRVAFQAPCTLQHALKLAGLIEPLLLAAGYTLTAVGDGQRCCGAAGTYFILQSELAQQLLRTKLQALEDSAPDVIATANIGCLQHLRSGASVPVRHWIELLAERVGDG